MDGQQKAEHPSALHPKEEIEAAVRSLVEQFSVVLGKPERVAECCSNLERYQSVPPSSSDVELLTRLLPLLTEHSGPLVLPLYDFIERTAASCENPRPLLKGMLAARDQSLVQRCLDLVLEQAEKGSLVIDRDLVGSLVELMDRPGACLDDPRCLPLVRSVVRHMKVPGQKRSEDPLTLLFLKERDPGIRRLAARLLDVEGVPASLELAEKALGNKEFEFLSPYLTYTRASHTDLLSLIPSSGVPPPSLPSLRRAQESMGEHLLRNIIAEAGWQHLNLGLEVCHYILTAPPDSLPFVLTTAEAKLADQCGATGKTPLILAIAHGGVFAENRKLQGEPDPASRFRNYNLAHADVLADFLAIAPLTTERVRSILERMDKIVGEFIGLFSSVSDECSVLEQVYREIKEKIFAEIEKHQTKSHLSGDLARLTVMFEDPQTIGQVRTLHGLKRYLHQKGLQLGFKLVQRALSTNRTITLFLTSEERILQKVEGIRYADFEPEADGMTSATRIPYAAAIVAKGFARQLLYGQESFPRVDIFCYGNEVHYFLAFRNHPAFLRINFSPPLQGGMIDLEYYGVSKYELAEHPDFSLNALRLFFRSLGFEIQVDNTRVHARFDKEQTADLKILCEKAEVLFCLGPYLLDIDWTIGSLNLDADAKQNISAAWAGLFAEWNALPLHSLLTKDRLGIVESIASTPAGKNEIAWSGKGVYRDRFSSGDGNFISNLFGLAEGLLPEITSTSFKSGREIIGQVRLERSLLRPLREAEARGELAETSGGYRRTPSDLFQRLSGPERFAELVAADGKALKAASTLAFLVAPLERILSFRTTGSVGYCETQSARLSLQDEDLGIHVMRTENKGPYLAFFTHGTVLYRHRSRQSDSWQSNASFDVSEFLSLLRRANYPVPGLEQLPPEAPKELHRIGKDLARALPLEPRRPMPGERTIVGLRASPGRAVGRVLFETKKRTPEDFAGAVLVTPALRPQDAPFLQKAAGVVSTGGGILSHAALLAAQFKKPALIVAGSWKSDPGAGSMLHYTTTEFELDQRVCNGYHVCSRRKIQERSHLLREGDLVVLDAQEDLLRVLGHDPDTLALHEGFRQFTHATLDLTGTVNDQDILLCRGRRIRARHQIEKIIARLEDPILACHAVQELVEDSGIGRSVTPEEKTHLLALMLTNACVGTVAANHLHWIARELRQRAERVHREVLSRIPDSVSVYEVLNVRMEALTACQSLVSVNTCLHQCGLETPTADTSWISEIERLASDRLIQLRKQLAERLGGLERGVADVRGRHLLRQWERTEPLVPAPPEEKRPIEALRMRLRKSDEERKLRLESRSIIWPDDGGMELYPFIGWKAANLAEARRISNEASVPPWFVVTDLAFREILSSSALQILPRGAEFPDSAPTLGAAIEAILTQSKLDRFQKSTLIRSLWDAVVIPSKLKEEILAAYRAIGEATSPSGQSKLDPLVALRSSSHEEDAEIAARAGEFDTFLFISGENALMKHLLWTWSGLWSDRALHTREMMRTSHSSAGGGVIIQRIVNSRVSGVLQTVNVARNNFREIVINAGWGLGEGIVSGMVGADQIIVSKEGDMVKTFSYMTADKREYVVFNKRAGSGTIRCDAPYHLRLRPALEYSELCELVAAAVRLESAYGYPLDIEFAIEESRLWILQVRPVPTSLSSLHETLRSYPLTRAGGSIKENNHHDQTRTVS